MTDDLLNQLLERIRSRIPEDRVVTADEVAAWPDGSFASLLRDGVIEEIQPVASVECDACFEGHSELVDFVEEPPGSPPRAYIACPDTGRVAVDPERMRRWQISAKTVEGRLPADETGERTDQSNGDFAPESAWPPTAAAFASILRQAQRAGAYSLRWAQLKERLATLGYRPNRARDVRRNVPNWDDIVESPRRGSYRLKP